MKKLFLALTMIGVVLAPVALAQDVIAPEVAQKLAFMREEEKLAQDVYMLFDTLYEVPAPGANVFRRIAESEGRHAAAVLKLLESYGLPDPAFEEPGRFLDQDLQAMYDTLVLVGQTGLTEALGVGVTIEQQDIANVLEAIEISVGYADIVQVYSNLLGASENHLATFLKLVDKAGLEDVPTEAAAR